MKTKDKNGKKEKTTEECEHKNRSNRIAIMIIFGITILLLTAIAIITLVILLNKQHDEAIAKYDQAWSDYSEAQREFGYKFGVLLGEMGYSTDGSSKYDLDYSDQYEIGKLCAEKVGIYDEVYDNSYAVRDDNISEKDTTEIIKAADSLAGYAKKIKKAEDSINDCKEIGKNKKKEIDSEAERKEAEAKAKADEEAAKKKQEEEERIAREKYALTYDKFNNQIHEGMSLSAVKEVYAGFDDQCKVSAQSGGYVDYSCTSSYSSEYWAASFLFYNGILKTKAQSGLK